MKESDTINLTRYLQIANKRKSLIFLVLIVAVVSAVVFSLVSTKTYRAIAVVQLSSAQDSLSGEQLTREEEESRRRQAASRLVETIVSDAVLSKAISGLGVKTAASDLRPKVIPTVAEDGTILTISVDFGNPRDAARIASALAREVVARLSREDRARRDLLEKRSEQLESELQVIEQRITLGEEALKTASLDPTLNSGGRITAEAQALQALSSLYKLRQDLGLENQEIQARLLELGEAKVSKAAEVPQKPNEHPLSFNVAFAAILGLAGGMAVAFLAELWPRAG